MIGTTANLFAKQLPVVRRPHQGGADCIVFVTRPRMATSSFPAITLLRSGPGKLTANIGRHITGGTGSSSDIQGRRTSSSTSIPARVVLSAIQFDIDELMPWAYAAKPA
jgi:hypothetical protein